MNYSRKQLEFFGEPLGDSATTLKPGGRVYGGGGSSAPSQQTVTQTSIPEYAKPYVETMLGKAQAATDQPYQAYGGQRIAEFSPMQQQAFGRTANQQVAGQLAPASQMAGMAGLGSLGAGRQYAQQATSPGAMSAYMSPYIQNALAPQMEEARRQAGITGQQQASQAAQQGAFGGARHGIVEAENARNLATLQNQIYGTGMQNAFQNAQQAQQFGATLGLQGLGQATQAAGQLGQLGAQQFGQETGITAAQQAAGATQQGLQQQQLSQQYQDFLTQRGYPQQQLSYMSDMLRGLPMSQSTQQMYTAPPNPLSQVAGLGLAAYGATKKEGGVIKMAKGGVVKRPAGLAELVIHSMSQG